MTIVLKGFFQDFDIGIIKYSNFKSKQFKSISALVLRLGLATV